MPHMQARGMVEPYRLGPHGRRGQVRVKKHEKRRLRARSQGRRREGHAARGRDEAREGQEVKTKTGIALLRDVLLRMRDDDQGGFRSYLGSGKWGFIETGQPYVTGDELTAPLALAGVVPDEERVQFVAYH